ncbi:hypothetical protein [Breoghania sp.]|uniref:hypothetical protein n=1 Tax=Breoghania sp. TaxID=2065378 RepID=UPI0026044523|nr:hypothetical protein [Breoghania sp.]
MLTWLLALVFAFTMLWSGALSFYFIFIPEYILCLVAYPLFCAMKGAKDTWPKQEAQQAAREGTLSNFEEQRDALEDEDNKEDPSAEHTARLAKWLLVGAGIMLLSMVALAIRIDLAAPSAAALDIMRDDFHFIAIACTLCYSTLAILAMRVTDANEG